MTLVKEIERLYPTKQHIYVYTRYINMNFDCSEIRFDQFITPLYESKLNVLNKKWEHNLGKWEHNL